MGKILCATRGGEASYRTQDAAIALAQERGEELLFLYVVDVKFLQTTARAVRPDVVSAEVEKMGEFFLAMAQERAQKQGVAASYILRHGELHEALKAAAREPDVALVVLGKPVGEGSAFASSDEMPAALERLKSFAEEIETETKTPVRIL
jgi:nucleotide-binding universal stress UspA family protein